MTLSIILIDQTTQASLGMLMATIAVMFCITTVVARDSKLRSSITSSVWWKLQFASHPLLVGSLVYWHGKYQHPLAKLLLVPIVFNFGVNQRLLPNDMLFLVCFYLHHMAPLLVFHNNIQQPHGDNDGGLFPLAQALLLGHAWALHTIGFLDHHFKWVNKQAFFFPYMMLGFVWKLYWWYNLTNDGNLYWLATYPIFLQYIGRWGLYWRLMTLFGGSHPLHGSDDALERRKQPVELAAFLLSYGIVQWVRK